MGLSYMLRLLRWSAVVVQDSDVLTRFPRSLTLRYPVSLPLLRLCIEAYHDVCCPCDAEAL